MARSLALGLFLLALAGCDGATTGGPGETCTERGARCRLPDGPIGVCVDLTTADCAEPPCLVCQPQH